MEMVARLKLDVQLGLQPDEMKDIVHTLCEDMYYSAHHSWGSANLDADTLNALLSEIDNPELQAKVLELCGAVTAADEHTAEGEMRVLTAAAEQWGLPRAVVCSAQGSWATKIGFASLATTKD